VPEFRFKAVSAASETIEGRMEAADRAALIDRLHALGHVPLRIERIAAPAPGRRLAARRRLAPRPLAFVTGQLATLLRAGVPLDEALAIVGELLDGRLERECVALLRDRVNAGASLADAMAAQRGAFPDYCINMVRAGEAGATLDTVLERLADFVERARATREHITSALLYPAVVALACAISILILLVFVVPRFRPLFEEAGDALPASARWLLAAADIVQAYWWAGIVAVLLVGLLVLRQARDARVRARWQRRWLRVPVIGELARKVEAARFARCLATLLRNGVPMLGALSITRDTLRNPVFADAVTRVIGRVETGRGLADPLAETGAFPPVLVHLVRIGEESGHQEDMLAKAADLFEGETQRNLDRLLALLAPAVTIVLGVVVAAVIMTILAALLSVYDLTM